MKNQGYTYQPQAQGNDYPEQGYDCLTGYAISMGDVIL